MNLFYRYLMFISQPLMTVTYCSQLAPQNSGMINQSVVWPAIGEVLQGYRVVENLLENHGSEMKRWRKPRL